VEAGAGVVREVKATVAVEATGAVEAKTRAASTQNVNAPTLIAALAATMDVYQRVHAAKPLATWAGTRNKANRPH
jgi:hypothetical protein